MQSSFQGPRFPSATQFPKQAPKQVRFCRSKFGKIDKTADVRRKRLHCQLGQLSAYNIAAPKDQPKTLVTAIFFALKPDRFKQTVTGVNVEWTLRHQPRTGLLTNSFMTIFKKLAHIFAISY